jgi:hypothetical protein
MVTTHRALVVLKLSNNSVALSKEGHAIIVAMTNNVWFGSPSPTLILLGDLLKALDDANVLAKAPGAAATRRTAMKAVVNALQQEAGYVQGIADANPAKAEEIILSAGMRVKRVTVRQRNTDQVNQGGLSGLVLLMAAVAGPTACYLWQWSTDQKNWTNLPQVFTSRTSVSGLTPATTYYFRYKTVKPKHGETDWSQVISLLVK